MCGGQQGTHILQAQLSPALLMCVSARTPRSPCYATVDNLYWQLTVCLDEWMGSLGIYCVQNYCNKHLKTLYIWQVHLTDSCFICIKHTVSSRLWQINLKEGTVTKLCMLCMYYFTVTVSPHWGNHCNKLSCRRALHRPIAANFVAQSNWRTKTNEQCMAHQFKCTDCFKICVLAPWHDADSGDL